MINRYAHQLKSWINKSLYPETKLTIVGSGIIGAMEAYFAWQEAKAKQQQIRITIYDKNERVTDSTSSNIIPSLTPDEILCVVPRGPEFVAKYKLLFSEPGGIRVDDVKGVNESETAKRFIEEVNAYSQDETAHQARTQALLALGKKSMELWKAMYNDADDELKQIFKDANFNPCRDEQEEKTEGLHDGYRIDLIYNRLDARQHADNMKKDYDGLGYTRCKVLTPEEVKAMDPYLADFCHANSELNADNECVWKPDAVALYRPGGCLDSAVFLPKFYDYLRRQMGQYRSDDGKMKDCFQMKLGKQVSEVVYHKKDPSRIKGLTFTDKTTKKNRHQYTKNEFVFCPGEAVGTMAGLGFEEPAYAGFAGPTLMLNIPVPAEQLAACQQFNHCMEVHQEGVVLAWQARLRDGKIFIGVGGTKAFYADKKPQIDDDFALNRHLLQLNMINDVLPAFMTMALGRETAGQKLTVDDLRVLEAKGYAKRWVGTRAVAYDGYPTLGKIYKKLQAMCVSNARVTTHLGSGGVSFAPAVVEESRRADMTLSPDNLSRKTLEYSSSKRFALFGKAQQQFQLVTPQNVRPLVLKK